MNEFTKTSSAAKFEVAPAEKDVSWQYEELSNALVRNRHLVVNNVRKNVQAEEYQKAYQ
jgi:hypothetical protein